MEPAIAWTIFWVSLGGAAGIFCLSAVVRCRRAIAALRRRLGELEVRIRDLEDRPGSEVCVEKGPVSREELAARFEKRDRQLCPQVSAKYQHVARLARSGLGPAELSDILDVSETAAEQMLHLARSAEKAA